MDDRDCYENCMHSTKITYENRFSRGFNSKISNRSFLTNSQKPHWFFSVVGGEGTKTYLFIVILLSK